MTYEPPIVLTGIDPGNDATGLGMATLASWTARPEVLLLGSVRGAPEVIAEKLRVSIKSEEAAVIGRNAVGGSRWGSHVGGAHIRRRIEVPPMQVRKDVRHGPQAQVGFALGFLSGWIAAVSFYDGVAPTQTAVRDWRAAMLELSASWGVHAEPAPDASRSQGSQRSPWADPEPPPRVTNVERIAAVEPRHVVTFECGHQQEVAYAKLVLATPLACDACAKAKAAPKARELTRPEQVTDEWKRVVCSLTRQLWPEAYATLVDDARSRARSTPPDHRLSGVPDACEALWVGLSEIRLHDR